MDLCLAFTYLGILFCVAAKAAFLNFQVSPVPLEPDRLYSTPLRADKQGQGESLSIANTTRRQK